MKIITYRLFQLFIIGLGDYILGFKGIFIFGFLSCFLFFICENNSKSILWTTMGAALWTLFLCLPSVFKPGNNVVDLTAHAFGLPSGIYLVVLTLFYITILTFLAGMLGSQFGHLLVNWKKYNEK